MVSEPKKIQNKFRQKHDKKQKFLQTKYLATAVSASCYKQQYLCNYRYKVMYTTHCTGKKYCTLLAV